MELDFRTDVLNNEQSRRQIGGQSAGNGSKRLKPAHRGAKDDDVRHATS
jgi:hypothetical protein